MIDFKKEIDQWGPVDAKVLYFSFWLEPTAFGAYKRWGAKWPEIVGVLKNERLTFYWEKEAMNTGGFEVIEKIFMNSGKRRDLWRTYENIVGKLQSEADKIDRTIKNKNNDFSAIQPFAVHWTDLFKEAWETGIMPELANFGAPAYLEKKLKPYVPLKEMHNVLEALLAPEDLSLHQQSEKELLELVLNNKSGAPEEIFEDYSKKWHWVENSYYETKKLSLEYFLAKIRNLKNGDAKEKLAEIESYLKSVKLKKKDIYARFKLPDEIQKLSSVLAHSIWWQDHRKGLAWWGSDTIDKFSRLAERELNVSFENILMYTASEWTEMFRNRKIVPEEIINERKKLTVFDCTPEGVFEYHGKKAEEIRNSLITKDSSPSDAEVKELKGIAVSSGKATGKVRILLSPRNDNMKNGEVLVAPMTSPDYIIAMRKASAIVTDVGGLMSHAAIVSRELGIPCIVGTKIATKVLKDGDLVEVDAERGMITIIN